MTAMRLASIAAAMAIVPDPGWHVFSVRRNLLNESVPLLFKPRRG